MTRSRTKVDICDLVSLTDILTPTELGVLVRLLAFHSWNGYLPQDDRQLARIAAVHVLKFRHIWAVIAPFTPAKRIPPGKFEGQKEARAVRTAREQGRLH